MMEKQLERINRWGIGKVIHAEGYSFYDPSDHITKVMLLANDKKLALIEMRKQPVWGWETFYTEFHDFVARYVDAIDSNINNTVVPPLIKGTEQMYLNVDYFSVNGRTLLFAHAISGKPNHSFGSEEVTEYIDSRLNELGRED
ncbi:hypothetical protein H1230_12955 [Paenibacillus sp. 19GGS1-52]|uniref:hypothetical protein n=1 Tax=Paenibacillus sp. 19GGS1-52 TaxID=2758563 RepID=UPI001EFBBFB6|nr:hypothetical protein [Paenibacillus sp. 19GGS1-52]ULO09594.1 hypothetical protein H1230_12955 [Paenibacillus sp. 19GGS1-52]